ncbi:MAG TPA: carboxypeptidase regulatory-like domain-containing protein [Terriglobales bacterium]|nr:carboxypeptidase regulatory-like domain-containing protein [Terriglobales bacterium]
MKFRLTHLLLSAVLVALILPNRLSSQTTTSGGLTGVVTDPSNAVVPSADVKIRNNATGTIQTAKTDREGVYRFFFLAPGQFTLTVTLGGFQEESRAVRVPLGPPISVNVILAIASANTSLTVTQEAQAVQAENGDVSTTMGQKQISEVPNPGNDITYIAQTAPGAVMNTDNVYGGNFSILGMPTTSYLLTVDGMHINDNFSNTPLVGALGLLLGQNQIEEATVISTGYSGQFGGAAGGTVNYLTKAGGNQLHGNAQYYWNGRVFNANNWINHAFGNQRPFDIANQWAGSLGGPLKKDKLFFFLDWEGLRLLLPQYQVVSIPSLQFEAATIASIDSKFGPSSASDMFYKTIFNLYNSAPGAASALPGNFFTDPLGCTGFSDPKTGLGISVPCARSFITTRGRPSQDTLTSGRVDWVATKNDRASVRLQYEHGRAAFITDPINSVFDTDVNQPSWQGELIETHTFGSSAASQFLVGGTYNSYRYRVKNSSAALAAFPTVLNFYAPGTYTSLGGADWFATSGVGRDFKEFQVSEDVAKTWHDHKFGFGADLVRIYWNSLPDRNNTIGQLNPQTLDAFYQGGVNPASATTDFTVLTQAFTAQGRLHISFFNLGLYGQDEWHARPDLTLTLGVRSEHYSNPVCENRCFARLAGPFASVTHDPKQPYNQAILNNQAQAVQHTDNILWSPRFSFAWQPFGVAHNSVLRGGVGIFYDPLLGNVQYSFSSNTPIYNLFTVLNDNLAPGERTNLFTDAAASNHGFLNAFSAGKTLAQIQATVPNFFPPAIDAASRTMHSPQYQRWSLEFQQGFGVSTSVSIGYFGHHGIDEVVQNANANAFGFGSLPAKLCTSPPVPPCADPRFSGVTEFETNAVSTYHGGIISLKHQFTRLTQATFQANYTYSHALDEVSNGGFFTFSGNGATSVIPQDPNNLRGSYGPAEYDVRHSFNANYVWEVPVKAALRRHGFGSLMKGWQVSGTIFARTGLPYTVFDNAESGFLQQNNYFGMIYAVPAGPLPSAIPCGEGAALPRSPHPCGPPQFLPNGEPNPSALFVQTGCETGFNAGNLPGPSGPCSGRAVALAQGRDRFRGPSYFNTDVGIMKNTKIPGWENGVLGIGFQFFNAFNHPNFGFPDGYSSSPTFGRIFYMEQPPTSILGSGLGSDASPRMIQLKAQLQF